MGGRRGGGGGEGVEVEDEGEREIILDGKGWKEREKVGMDGEKKGDEEERKKIKKIKGKKR